MAPGSEKVVSGFDDVVPLAPALREEGRLYSDVLVQQGPPVRTAQTKSSRSSKVVFETGQPR